MRDLFKAVMWVGMPAALLIVAGVFDASAEHGCRTSYDTSLSGLYIIKTVECRGRLGIPHEPREVARKPLFSEF